MSEQFYPLAVQRPLTGHSAPGTMEQKNTVILHITDGSTAASAITTFEQSKKPNRKSSHFVIDRDGTVYQLLPLADVAWHARQSNYHSVGVEHAGIPVTLLCTPEQYAASAALVAWLCQQLDIPCDRA